MTNEPIETIEVDEEETLGEEMFQAIVAEHTILEVWDNIFQGAESESHKKINIEQAVAMLKAWDILKLNQLPHYRAKFYEHLDVLHTLLKERVEQDETCLEHAKDDAEWNREIYLQVSLDWNDYFDACDAEWDCTDEYAAPELAALADAASFAVTDNGLLGYLNHIGLSYSSDDVVNAKALRNGEED